MSTRGTLALGTIVLASSLVLAASPTSARADDDTAGALSPPPLALSLSPGSGGGPWKLRIENTGDVPVRVAADPRLVVLEVTPPAGFVDEAAAKAKRPRAAPAKAEEPKTVRCMLPDDARPATDEGRDLVVPAKRSWTAAFDPLLYCFGARERAVLVTGATVKAHFGWPAPAPKPGAQARAKTLAPAPPFVAAPVGAAIGRNTPAKDLEAPPITLAENVARAAPAAPAPASDALSISMPDTLDVSRGTEISTSVTIANESGKSQTLLFRPETLRFNVAGPAGSVSCGSLRTVASPIRELYSTVGVKGRTSISVLITAICPSDTFDEPGIYRITPVLDTTNASGRPIGLRTWDGVASGRTPMLLRVRSPRRPSASTTRPALD